MKKKNFAFWGRVVVLVLLLNGDLYAAGTHFNSTSPLGINTNDIMDSSTSLPFIDLFRMSLPFEETKRIPNYTRGDIQYDRYGWPTDLRGGQVGTRFLNAIPAKAIPVGNYTVLYDGEGKIMYKNDAHLVRRHRGYDIIHIKPGHKNEITGTLFITESNPRNPLRNIRILMPGGICGNNIFKRVNNANECPGRNYLPFKDHYNRIVFNPDYLNFMKDFRVIRFMNMSGFPPQNISEWWQMPSIHKSTWGSEKQENGVPLEIMVMLANQLNADPWFIMPYQASDDFVQKFAHYVKQNLKPGLKTYIEYTNEAWNSQFPEQFHALTNIGLAQGLDSDPIQARIKYYSKRSVEIFKIWEQTFGSTTNLIRVMSGWTSKPDMTKTLITYNNAYQHIDAFGIGPYVFGEYKAIMKARSLNQLFHALYDPNQLYSLPKVLSYIKGQADVLKPYDIDLVAYEGGQHLVDPSQSNKKFIPLFSRANKDSRMIELYNKLMHGWKEAGGKLFVHFAAPRRHNKFGSFGLKEYITQPSYLAPKYRAVIAFLKNNPCWWNSCHSRSSVAQTTPYAPDFSRPATQAQQQRTEKEIYNDYQKTLGSNTAPKVIYTSHSANIQPNFQKVSAKHIQQSGLPVITPARSRSNMWNGHQYLELKNILTGKINNQRDLAAKWQAHWDRQFLHLQVKVLDDQHIRDSSRPWSDDSIEIFIDADNSKRGRYDGQNDLHLIYRWNDRKVGFGKNSPQNLPENIRQKMSRTNDGYLLETSIPWSLFNTQPTPGMRIGLDVHVNDDDDGRKRDGKLAWYAQKDDAWKDPSLLGTLVLGQ